MMLFCVAAAALFPLPAQDRLSGWEEKIAAFETEFNPDSLAFYYQKIAQHHRQENDLASWAYAWWDWQAAVFDDTPLALSLLDSVVQTAWRAPQTPEEAEAMLWVQVNRGYHLFQLGKVLASVKAYEAALQWYQNYAIPDFEALDYLYLPLGAHYTRLGDNEKARVLYETAALRHPEGPEDGALAGLYNNLGLTYWNEGDQDKALLAFDKGLACRDVPAVKSALLHFSSAQSLLAAGRSEAAEPRVNTAIALLQEVKRQSPEEEALPDYLSGAYAVKAKLLSQNGDTPAALSYLNQALIFIKTARGTARHRDVAKIQLELGRLHLQKNDPEQALEAFHAALGNLIPDLPEAVNALPATEQLYEENTIYEALEGKADALWAQYGRSRQLDDLRTALHCHRLAAGTELLLRRLLQYESSKITLLSQSRQRAAKAIAIARELYAVTGDEGFLYEAWAVAEQAKSVILLEAVQSNRFHSSAEAGDTLPAAERRIRKQIAYFDRLLLLEPASPLRPEWVAQLDELQRQLAETERQLEAQYPAWVALRAQAEVFSGASVKALRDTLPGYALIEFFVGTDDIEVFGQSPNGQAIWKTIPRADSVSAQVQSFILLLQSREALQTPGAYRASAYDIYTRLLQPALSAFGTQQPANVLIVPDAWLAFLPFEALYYEPAPEAGWERAPFLLKRYGIHYDFSLAVLENRRGLVSRAGRNIAQFSPRFEAGQRNLPPLLHSSGEAPVSKRCQSALYEDERAGLAELQQAASQYAVLHLSTHAGVDTGGLLPRVELFDRAAYLPDVYALNLQSELVVLSACQTALGRFRQGEGVMSLSRAFAYAGAKGLVASLWMINEVATARVLQAMYAELNAGAAKPAALRQAKLRYLDDPDVPAFEKSPYYWAGLVYTGDEASLRWKKCGMPRPTLFALGVLLLAGGLFGVFFKKWRTK
ncbi:MAG: CHAT domain-containing protein [Saprospiraceae bacterium]|nr:CHAT domain-containing protein [Saprospiraceae bacterium]